MTGDLFNQPDPPKDVVLRDYQQDGVDGLRQSFRGGSKRTILQLPTGCHAKGTKVVMFDGALKAVEDVAVGDLLMGPDSKPRTVKHLCRGIDQMYEIIPKRGMPFVVNGEHILSLISTPTGESKHCPAYTEKHGNEIVNISVNEYLSQSRNFKHLNKLYRTGVEFPGISYLAIDPYFLGILLGDGCLMHQVSVCTPDAEIRSEIYQQAANFDLSVRVGYEDSLANSYFISRGRNQKVDNRLRSLLERMGLMGKKAGGKFIPSEYKTASREQRLELLAGLMDTDGSTHKAGYDYITKSEHLAGDIAFLARSLGFQVNLSKCVKGYKGFSGEYFRLYISGDCHDIPCRVPHKVSEVRKQKKRHNVSGFDVVGKGSGAYYGFEIDGDHLYLLEDFTVTHNSGKTLVAMYMIQEAIKKGKRTCFVVDQVNLCTQTYEAAEKLGVEYGVIQSNHPKFNIYAPLQVGTIQSLRAKHKNEKNDRLFKHFDLIIVDESHIVFKALIEWMDTHEDAYYVGLSATPFTKGLGNVWGDLVVGPTAKQLIDAGHLCDFDAYAPSHPDLSDVKVTAGDYNEKALSETMRNRVIYADIVSTWKKLGGNQKTIAFCVDIAHANEMAEEFEAAGVGAKSIHSKLSKEEQEIVMQGHQNGEFPVLCSIAMVVKGYDDPSAVVAIDAAPTKSLSRHIQKMGRILRQHETKDKAIILDHANNLSTLGLPTDDLPRSLCKANKGEQSKLQEREEPLPKECPSCKYMKPPRISVCPACGFKPKRFSDVEVTACELKKMTATQKKKVKGKDISDLAGWYAFFQSFGKKKSKYPQKWAEEKFSKEFGFHPREKFGDERYEGEIWTAEHRQWVANYNRRTSYASRKFGGRAA